MRRHQLLRIALAHFNNHFFIIQHYPRDNVASLSEQAPLVYVLRVIGKYLEG